MQKDKTKRKHKVRVAPCLTSRDGRWNVRESTAYKSAMCEFQVRHYHHGGIADEEMRGSANSQNTFSSNLEDGVWVSQKGKLVGVVTVCFECSLIWFHVFQVVSCVVYIPWCATTVNHTGLSITTDMWPIVFLMFYMPTSFIFKSSAVLLFNIILEVSIMV